MPCYIFNEFIRACKKRRNITVWPKVIPEAYKDFGLWDEEAIITFIANDGIQNQHSKTLNYGEEIPIHRNRL